MGTNGNAVVDRLRTAAQTSINGAENLTASLLAFTYAALASGRLTLGELTSDTARFVWDGTETALVAVVGDSDAGTAPLVTTSPGNVSLYRSICLVMVAVFRCGTKKGGHDATTPAGALALVDAVTGTTTQKGLQKVAGKMRPLLASDKAPTVKAVTAAAKKATTVATRTAGTGTVQTATPKKIHGVANALVGHVATADWSAATDGADHLDGTITALETALADAVAIRDGMDVDAAFMDEAMTV